MKKPNPKAAAVNVINLTLRGATNIDKIRMIVVERKFNRQKKTDQLQKMHEAINDLEAAFIAQDIVAQRLVDGVYADGTVDPEADLRLEIAFAKIVIRNR